jgi:hypothetical protein
MFLATHSGHYDFQAFQIHSHRVNQRISNFEFRLQQQNFGVLSSPVAIFVSENASSKFYRHDALGFKDIRRS